MGHSCRQGSEWHSRQGCIGWDHCPVQSLVQRRCLGTTWWGDERRGCECPPLGRVSEHRRQGGREVFKKTEPSRGKLSASNLPSTGTALNVWELSGILPPNQSAPLYTSFCDCAGKDSLSLFSRSLTMHRERPSWKSNSWHQSSGSKCCTPGFAKSAPRQPRTWELPEASTPPREGAKPFLQAERRAGKKKIRKGGERANRLHESTEEG